MCVTLFGLILGHSQQSCASKEHTTATTPTTTATTTTTTTITTTIIIITTSSVNFYKRGTSNADKTKSFAQFHSYIFNFID
jgi:hypothetical protein